MFFLREREADCAIFFRPLVFIFPLGSRVVEQIHQAYVLSSLFKKKWTAKQQNPSKNKKIGGCRRLFL